LTLVFFNISGGEIFIIILVIFIIFGPDKIPEIARWIGKGMNEVKKATNEIKEEIEKETGDITKITKQLKKDIEKETGDLKNITGKSAAGKKAPKEEPHL
jgi:sec-independent protein translocase protein TatA